MGHVFFCRHRLMDLTAEIAESHYGRARKSFKEQTQSLGLQIHYNSLFAMQSGHACRWWVKMRSYAKNGMDHAFIDKNMHVYKYLCPFRANVYQAKRYLLKRLSTDDGFDWATVGVFEIVGISQIIEKINASDVRGRAIICQDKKRMYTWTEDLQHM